MNKRESQKYWNESADTWTQMARAGYDIYRDIFNTPDFFRILPDIKDLKGLDIGCGEGYNTRLVAQKGAQVSAIDISEIFIKYAQELEQKEPLGIQYRTAFAEELPFPDNNFDFATAFMSMMDTADKHKAIAEAYRVLKPGGFLQFSICHPCFDTPHRRNLRDGKGLTYAIEVGDYFREVDGEVMEWHFNSAPKELKEKLPKLKTPRFHCPVSQWFNMLAATGFKVEKTAEPRPTDEQVKKCPGVQDAQVVSYFLHIRVRK
jgi:ubiquinone/menaquinone biosynthesis C-methylase UbiE